MSQKIVTARDAKLFLEGPEVCRQYYRTQRITFGTSELQPGQTGAVDVGHADSEEVFYVVKGTVLLMCGEELYELHERDAMLIPPTMPHRLTNIGDCLAVVSWSMAPSE